MFSVVINIFFVNYEKAYQVTKQRKKRATMNNHEFKIQIVLFMIDISDIELQFQESTQGDVKK